jgi:DNA repair protein RecO (recombination protein O)
MKKVYKARGFVLKTYDFRETSKIALFYTAEFGKIKGILKGIRCNRKRFSTTLDLATLNEIIFYRNKNRDMHLVSRCDLIEDFPFIRRDFQRINVSYALLELTDKLLPLEEKNTSLFALLEFSLNLLNRDLDPEKLWIFFQVKALKFTGFRPELKYCLLCHKDLSLTYKIETIYFSLAFGGLLCSECKDEDKNAKKLLKGVLASLSYMEKMNPERLHSFKLNRDIKCELQNLLKRFIEFHSEIEIKSDRLLREEK